MLELETFPHINYSNESLNQTNFNIRNNIVNTLFKTKHNVVNALTQTIRYLHNDKYTLSVSIIDSFMPRTDLGSNIRSTSEYVYNNLIDNSDLKLKSYNDEQTISYKSPLTIQNMNFVKYVNTDRFQKELVVYNIPSYIPKYDELKASGNVYLNGCNYRNLLSMKLSSDNSIKEQFYTPICIRLVKNDNMNVKSLPLKIGYIQRQQSCVYEFKDKSLSSWTLSKIVRFITINPSDNKLTADLHINNVLQPSTFDTITIQFNYVGSFEDLTDNLYRLFEYIYRDYNLFSIKYNLINNILNIKLISLMNDVKIVSKNDISSRNITDLILTYNIDGEHVLLVIYDGCIYELTTDSFTCINDSFNKLTLQQLSLKILSFHKPTSKYINRLSFDDIPTITIFECTKDKNNCYHVYDLHYFDSFVLSGMKYLSKLVIIDNLVNCFTFMNLKLIPVVKTPNINADIKLPFINEITSTADIWKILSKNVNGIVSRIINPVIEHEYNNCLLVKAKSEYTIKFQVMFDNDKHCFLLYTKGNVNNVVKHYALYNKFTIKHFGISTVQNINSSVNNLLFVNPYYNIFCKTVNIESFMFVPNINWNDKSKCFVNEKRETIKQLVKNMIDNPYNYHKRVLKFTLTEEGWIPIKLMSEDVLPHTYPEALHITSKIYESAFNSTVNNNTNDVITDTPLSNKLMQLKFKQQQSLLNIHNLVNELINMFIIEKLSLTNVSSMIDIINSESVNGNVIQTVSLINSIYVIANDPKLIVNYVSSLVNRNQKRYLFNQIDQRTNNNANVVNISTNNAAINNIVNVNVIDKCLSFDNNDIVSVLNGTNDYKLRSIDVIFVQNIDDICNSVINLLAFIKLCREVLNPNGQVIFKHLDSDEIKYITKRKDNHNLKYITECGHEITFDDSYDNLNDDNIDIINVFVKATNNQVVDDGSFDVNIDDNKVIFSYDDQQVTIDCKHLPNVGGLSLTHFPVNAIYYNSINGFNTKRLSKNIKRNIKNVLNINVELFGTMFSHDYEYWYSEHHCVDVIFGSLGDSNEIINEQIDIDDNILIERSKLTLELVNYIQNVRTKSKFSTVIVTKSELKCVKQIQEGLFIIYPAWVRSKDCSLMQSIIDEYLLLAFETNKPIIEFIQYDDIFNEKSLIKHPLMNQYFGNILNNWFVSDKRLKPLKEYEVTKYISSNSAFNDIKQVETIMQCITYDKFIIRQVDEYNKQML